MASEREVDELATQVTRGLKLDPGGQLLDMEELVYKASPAELETLRQQVLMKQDLSGFDDEGLIERFVQATKPRGVDNGAGDNSQSYFNCFQNQIMMAMVVERSEQLPPDLMQQWMCVVCPQGSRVLVIASHKSTRVYDLEGTWICEHDTHLPGGSPSDISKLDVFTDDRGCTILDCLFNNEQEIYYVVDLLCWKGQSYYKYDTSVRMKTVAEKMEEVPSLMVVSQTNPFKFYSLPVASGSGKDTVSTAITKANFEISGVLFYHQQALYLPGLSPLGVWLETSYVTSILGMDVAALQALHDASPSKRDWRKTRYEQSPQTAKSAASHDKQSTSNKQQQQQQRSSGGGGGGGGKGRQNQGGGRSNSQQGNRYHQQFHNFSLNPFYPAYQGAYGYGNYGDYGGYDNYRGYGGYNSGGYNQGSYNQMNYNQMGYNPGNFNHGNYGQGNYNRTSTGQQRMFPQQFNYSHQGYRDNQRGHQKNKADGPIKRIQLSIPVPDDRPNWPDYERHDVMMSVSMEYVPENFETEYMAVICPVAKRRIVVSYFGWTCSYNKLLNMDRKFQSALPGGNVHSVQVIKSNDMCILDCLHLKAERTFYILDLMHWKQLPYYQSEAEFRFHWINQVENEMDLTTIHPENEYKFKSMPRLRCTRDVLYNALANSTFKVDGLLFFHINGLYTPGTSPNVLWLPPEEIESVLGWKPPDHILPKKAKAAGAASKPAAAESAAGESSAADEATSAAAAATS